MKVVLATSPHVKHGSVLQRDFQPHSSMMYSFAPVGILSLVASVTRTRSDDSVSIYDLNRRVSAGAIPLDERFYEAIALDLLTDEPEVVGFMTECDSYHHVLQICASVKRLLPTCITVLGGPHASVVADATFASAPQIDAIVVGEGEISFPALLDSLELRDLLPVSGVTRRLPDGTVLNGGTRALVPNLDDLPIPAYHLYRADPDEEIFLEVGRGCPFQCEFCSTAPYWRRRHRVKSAERILSEITVLKSLFGTQRVHFTHDLFTTNRKWVEEVCHTLIEAAAPIKWTCSARTDTVDRSLLDLMAAAGCNAIYFGLESGSPRILSEIRKDIPIHTSFQAIDDCRAAGITPNVGFIVGFPTEDNASLRETFEAYEWTLRNGCKPAHIFGYCPFVGSALYPRLEGFASTGHFVDIPLGAKTDQKNRDAIAASPLLHASYFRAGLIDLVPGQPRALDAIDEFSPLVEFSLVPALELAVRLGGLYHVYEAWLTWIQQKNRKRAVPAFRVGYGTPADFALFLGEKLDLFLDKSSRTLSYARFLAKNLSVGETSAEQVPISIASYRSIEGRHFPVLDEIALSGVLVCRSVVDCLMCEFDVSEVMLGTPVEDASDHPTYLIWQRTNEGTRLLSVDSRLFAVVSAVWKRPSAVGDLLIDCLGNKQDIEIPEFLHFVQEAALAGILEVDGVR